ncbi:MAG: sensor histidine kinase [Firmicutes bacterium]|nr:sensor histidine kinase [Bacillota bacterium]
MKKRLYGGMRLSTITVMAIGISAAASVIICMLIFNAVFNRGLRQDAATSSQQAVTQTAVEVENYLDDLKKRLTNISDEIYRSVSVEDAKKSISVAARFENDINAIVVYDADGRILMYGGGDGEIKKEPCENLSFDKEIFDAAEDFAVMPPHVQTLFKEQYPWVVTIARRVYRPALGGEVYEAMDFEFSHIANYIDSVGIANQGYCYIADSDGKIIYHPQQQMIFSGIKSENTEELLKSGEGVHFEKNVIRTVKPLSGSSWSVVGVSNISDLVSGRMKKVFAGILYAFVFCVAAAAAAIQLYSQIVTKPVKRLVSAMQTFEKEADSFSYRPEPEKVRELKILSATFSHMVGMIQELMEKVRREEIVLRKTELKALQAQINPHFLYNTLDSIQWMCERGKTDDAVKMVGALAKLFRISISRGHELISIEDELKHAESYLVIQSFRYKNQFTYKFSVDKSVEDCLCNKITVQPLIENAIYHGIDRMVDEGSIDITVRAGENDDIFIDVKDNGIGMTEEQCRNILQKERSDSGGIGVKNVNDRIKMYFGEEYGLSIESEPDEGTKVTLHLPQIRKEPENEA